MGSPVVPPQQKMVQNLARKSPGTRKGDLDYISRDLRRRLRGGEF